MPGDEGMAGFVIGGATFILRREDLLALRPDQDAVGSALKVHPVELVLALARGQQGRFVRQVAQVGPGHADHLPGDQFQIHVLSQRLRARVHFEDIQAALPSRAIDRDMTVKPSGAKQGRIEHVRPVGSRQHDDHLVWLEAVHFAEDLIEGLLAFVGAAADAGATHAADRVDLIDK